MLDKNIQFERVGGSLQPIIRKSSEIMSLLDLPAAYWSITSISVDAVSMDPDFLKFIDSDNNGKIRIDEVKDSLQWLKKILKNLDGLERGSEVLRFCDLTDDPEALAIRASATLAMKNTGIANPEEISLSDINDRKKITAAGLANGDGIIPPDLLEGESMKTAALLIMKFFGTAKDASGLEGFNQEALTKFTDTVSACLAWLDQTEQDPAILAFGDKTKEYYTLFKDIEAGMDHYFEMCGALRLFGTLPNTTAAPNVMNAEEIETSLKKAPIAVPDSSGIFSTRSEWNPQWKERLSVFFKTVLPETEKLSEAEWVALKQKFAPYSAWLASKPSTIFDTADITQLRTILTDGIPAKLQAVLDEDASHAAEIEAFEKVKKLILYQQNLAHFLNNYANLAVLFNQDGNSILLAGTLIMDGRSFRLVTKVSSIAEHKKIADRSNICIMYITAQTGMKETVRQMQLAVAVTSGDMLNLFVGKYGVFFTPDGTVWDAKVVDYIQQPVSFREALRMPFYRFAEFIRKRIDKLLSEHSKEFEKGFDKNLAAIQKPVPAAPPVPNTAANGSMMLMGSGVGLAAIGSIALIAQSLKNASIWSLLGILLAIIFLFGGPMVIVSLVKLYRRNIAVFLEASGLAINKRMRLSHAMGRIFTQQPGVPYVNRAIGIDVVQSFFKKEEKHENEDVSPWPMRIVWIILLIAFLVCAGIVAGKYFFVYLSK